jgi:hypothetical protein
MTSRKKPNSTTQTALTKRILDAADNIRVVEIIDAGRLKQIPPNVRRLFSQMFLAWAPNRAWGTSFQLGDDTVTVGHRRGDHIATFPWLHSFSPNDAERLLRLQIEGTLLHELGHAIFDQYLRNHDDGMKRAAKAALSDGAPSSYRGQDVSGMAPEDLLHEMFAEAFRYWCHNDPDLRESMPAWTSLVNDVVANAEDVVTSP